MKNFIGTKLVNGVPMNRGAYNVFRKWELPSDEDGTDEGYLVEYLDGGEPNTPEYNGYVSWSPKEQFENAYRETIGMNFGLALEALQKGHKVARIGWNGKNMFLIYVAGSPNVPLIDGTPYDKALNTPQQGQSHVSINPHIDMFTADGLFQPGWLASQTDMLATDWMLIE